MSCSNHILKLPPCGGCEVKADPSNSSVRRIASFTWDEYQAFESEQEFNKEFDKRAVEVNPAKADSNLNETP